MEYCTVHNSTDDATFAAQKKNQGTLHSICLYFIYGIKKLSFRNSNWLNSTCNAGNIHIGNLYVWLPNKIGYTFKKHIGSYDFPFIKPFIS
jgi:hypothetical protein